MEDHRIIDASTIIAAYVEDNKAALETIKNADHWFVLSFTLLEVANALRFSYKDYASEQFSYIGESLRSLAVVELPYDEIDLQAALDVSVEVGDSVYDALYHVVAMNRGHTFTTMDKKYYNRAKHLGNIELVT